MGLRHLQSGALWARNNGMTELEALQAELAKARREAEEAKEAKRIFLANMSHEIRSPLNGIMGMAYLALNTELTDEQRNHIEKIHKTCLSLLAVINDLLDFAKIETNRMELENQPMTPADELEAVLGLIQVQAQAKKLRLATHVADDVPQTVSGDSLRLRQILLNLASNAVKFSKKGTVTLAVSVLEQSGDKVRLRFSVTDEGIGMSAEDIAHVFKPFTQADEGSSRSFGGTGLGLALCQRLAGLMGGNIGVESEVNKGSTFHADLPFTLCAEPVAAESIADEEFDEDPQASLLGLRVLLVEDNEINLEIMVSLLEDMGVIVTPAVNGQEAVDVWKTKHVDIDVILSDIQMPVMDGYTAARQIRASGLPRAEEIPIIALTAHAMRGDAELSFAAGMNEHLTKPIDVDQITRTLAKYAK